MSFSHLLFCARQPSLPTYILILKPRDKMEDQECVIEERECIMEERECVNHAKDVFTSFERMKNDEQFCDFILKIGEEEIPVHRMVLAACSKYFHAMFSNDTKEAKTGRVEILGIEPSVGKQCLEFAYTGKIKFSRENPKDLIHSAELMQLHSLVDLYFEYLVENISTENCLEYMVLALTYNQQSFAKIFEKFLGENFAEIIKTEDFASMSRALLSQCLNSICDRTAHSEKLKWEAVTAWIYAELENRKDDFPKVFKLIKLENLPTDFIKKKIAKEALIRQSSELTGPVLDALTAPEGLNTIPDFPTHIAAFHNGSSLLHKYDLKAKRWSRFMRVPADIFSDYLDIVSKEREIYIGTGSVLSRYHDGVWTKLLTTGNDSCYCQCVVGGPFVFMVTRASTVKYDTRNNTVDQINTGCGLGNGFSIAVSNDWLYAIGGQNTGKKAKEFDPTTKTWETIADMQYERIYRAAAFFRGKLFALGGEHKVGYGGHQKTTSPFEYYEPSVDNWIALEATKAIRNKCSLSHFKVHIIGEKLYAIENSSLELEELALDFKSPDKLSMETSFLKLGLAPMTILVQEPR